MLKKLLLAAAVLTPAAAIAQPIQGLYIGGDVGADFAQTMTSANSTTKVATSPGPVALGAIGWGFGNGLRAEIEGSFRSNGIGKISTLRTNGQTLPLANPSGNVRTYAAMVNLSYDIPYRPLGVQPYIGAGAGYARLDLGNATGNGFATFRLPNNNTYGPAPDAVAFGSAGAFAYQAIAGTSLPIAAIPGLFRHVARGRAGRSQFNDRDHNQRSNPLV